MRRRKKGRRNLDWWQIMEGLLITCKHSEDMMILRAYDKWGGRLLAEHWYNGFGTEYWAPYHPSQENRMSKFLKKALAAASSGKGKAKGPPEKWLAEFPALQELLTLRKNDDGSERTPCSLTLSPAEEGHKGCLRELDEGLMLWATSGTLQGVLEALDSQLQSEAPDWRRDKFHKGKGKGK